MNHWSISRKLRRVSLVLPLFTCLWLSGCDNIEVATKPDETDVLRKIRTGQHELILKTELAQLKKDAEVGRSTGRYQIHREGPRTWRLDTATGNICLLLTTEADWKKPETTAQSCSGTPEADTINSSVLLDIINTHVGNQIDIGGRKFLKTSPTSLVW